MELSTFKKIPYGRGRPNGKSSGMFFFCFVILVFSFNGACMYFYSEFFADCCPPTPSVGGGVFDWSESRPIGERKRGTGARSYATRSPSRSLDDIGGCVLFIFSSAIKKACVFI